MICSICFNKYNSNPIIRDCGCKNFLCKNCSKKWDKCIFNCKINKISNIDTIFIKIFRNIDYLKRFLDNLNLINNNLLLFILVSFIFSFLLIFPTITLYSILSDNSDFKFIKFYVIIFSIPIIINITANLITNIINTTIP